jgi:hypothetical protein
MAVICSCDELGIPNTGFDCFLDPQVSTGIWLVPYFDSDNTVNTLKCADMPFDKTYFDGLVNNADKSQRVYPLPAVDNVEDVRADSVIFTTSGGVNRKVKDGVRSFSGLLFDSPAFLIDSLERSGCVELGVFFIDLNGNIIGNGKYAEGELAPFRIQKGTTDVTYVKATDTDPSSISFKFDYNVNEKDKNIGGISADDIVYSPSLVTGLLDVTAGAATAITLGGFTTETTTNYGDACSSGALKGAVVGDWVLYNETQASSVTILTADESPAGTYSFTYADQTSADVLTLSLAKDGYEMTPLSITTP